MTDVAVVIDGASNIGYQVLRKLIKCYQGSIYFTTEEKLAGYKILDELKVDALRLYHHQLDVTETQSIIDFRHYMQDAENGIDLLINNTEYKPKKEERKRVAHAETVRRVLNVNFYGNLNLGKLLYPLLKENARVVNVSGAAGLLATIPDPEKRNRISNPNLDEDGLVHLMHEYEAAVQRGIEVQQGWSNNAFAMSKVALNALTFLQHREWSDKGVVINCVNPGHMTSKDERKSAKIFEEGANSIIYLAMEAPLHIKGNFVWSNYSVIDWNSDPYLEVTRV